VLELSPLSAMGYPPPIAAYVFLVLPVLVIGALVCLVGIRRKSWISKKRAVGVFLLAVAVLTHGIFITGAATFGPTSVMTAEIFTFRCAAAYTQTCDTAILSTNRGYLNNVRLPQPVDMHTFLGKDSSVTLQLSLWDAKIHWIRTDNTSPPTIVGHPPTVSYYAIAEVLIGATLLYLAWLLWRKAKRRRWKEAVTQLP
jgi:hypothetical protein